MTERCSDCGSKKEVVKSGYRRYKVCPQCEGIPEKFED